MYRSACEFIRKKATGLLSRKSKIRCSNQFRTKNIYRPVGRAVTRSSLERRSEVQISGRSNRTHYCQRLATAATFLQKKLCCPCVMTRRWAPPTCYTFRRSTARLMKHFIENCKHPKNIRKGINVSVYDFHFFVMFYS